MRLGLLISLWMAAPAVAASPTVGLYHTRPTPG